MPVREYPLSGIFYTVYLKTTTHGYFEENLDENVQRFFQLLILCLQIMLQISTVKHWALHRFKKVPSSNKRLPVISAASQKMTFFLLEM